MAIHTYSSFKGERKSLNRIFAADLQFGILYLNVESFPGRVNVVQDYGELRPGEWLSCHNICT